MDKSSMTEDREPETSEATSTTPKDNQQSSSKQSQSRSPTYDLSNISDMIGMFNDDLTDDQIKENVAGHIKKLASQQNLPEYEIVLLYDDYHSISHFHSNKIYQAISQKNRKDILLILQSAGGRIEPAYLISKTCKLLCNEKFSISIPRRAKSAATLISLGANELHMGLLSELGPIDPQFGGFPASGLTNAMEKIAEMAERFPGSSGLLANYLTENLSIKDLGYFERINESAVQYAERLLRGKSFPSNWSAETVANHLTNHYKDHGFVIDSDEATSLLGSEMIKENTKEYELGNDIYAFLDFLDFIYKAFRNKNIRYVGSIQDGLHIFDHKEN